MLKKNVFFTVYVSIVVCHANIITELKSLLCVLCVQPYRAASVAVDCSQTVVVFHKVQSLYLPAENKTYMQHLIINKPLHSS